MNDGSVDENDIPSDISDSDSESESDYEIYPDDDDETRSRKRELRLSREAKRQHHDKKRRMLANYNEFNYYSRPTSIQVVFCEWTDK